MRKYINCLLLSNKYLKITQSLVILLISNSGNSDSNNSTENRVVTILLKITKTNFGSDIG